MDNLRNLEIALPRFCYALASLLMACAYFTAIIEHFAFIRACHGDFSAYYLATLTKFSIPLFMLSVIYASSMFTTFKPKFSVGVSAILALCIILGNLNAIYDWGGEHYPCTKDGDETDGSYFAALWLLLLWPWALVESARLIYRLRRAQ